MTFRRKKKKDKLPCNSCGKMISGNTEHPPSACNSYAAKNVPNWTDVSCLDASISPETTAIPVVALTGKKRKGRQELTDEKEKRKEYKRTTYCCSFCGKTVSRNTGTRHNKYCRH